MGKDFTGGKIFFPNWNFLNIVGLQFQEFLGILKTFEFGTGCFKVVMVAITKAAITATSLHIL